MRAVDSRRKTKVPVEQRLTIEAPGDAGRAGAKQQDTFIHADLITGSP